MDLNISIPAEQLRMMQDALSPKQFADANYQAVKRTTAHLVKLVREQVKREVPDLADKYLKRVIDKKDPSGDPPVGKVIVKHDPIPAIAFPHVGFGGSRTGLGVVIKFGADRPPLELHHAFIAKMASGHIGIFTRSRALPTSGLNAGKLNNHGQPVNKLTAQGFAGRLRIDERFGPPIVSLVSVPKVLDAMVFDAQKYLLEMAASQMTRFTGQKYDVQEKAE